ncbi:hypothetical protein IKF15_01800 [Candidatus Saccharibacteria bacterium]|nr:hypothetical protein [Candidatus Saccharibacteria bacterium]
MTKARQGKETPEQRRRRKLHYATKHIEDKLRRYRDAEPGSSEEAELDLELQDEVFRYNCTLFDLKYRDETSRL